MRQWRLARSLTALRNQVDSRYPTRSRLSDGTIGDAAHLSRDSDHNAWYELAGERLVTAIDLTHDPICGLDMDEFTDQLAAGRDPRIKYVIFARWIMDTRPGNHPWQWVRYYGSNPHIKHGHLSVMPAPACDDTKPWDLAMLGGSEPVVGDLALGSRGERVRELQRVLNAWYPWVNLSDDGIFGPATEAAVKELQRRAGLEIDGIVGPATRAVLNLR